MQSETLKPCDKNEREAIKRAIKTTEYKYFGDYEFSDDQHEAVDRLVLTAQRYLAWNNRPDPTSPAESAGLVERLKYCDEHGIFKAVEDRMSASYDEAVHHIAAQDAEIARLRDALGEAREEVLWCAYHTGHVKDGRWTHMFMSDGEGLAADCGFDPRQADYDDAAIRAAIPVAARAALNPETGHG